MEGHEPEKADTRHEKGTASSSQGYAFVLHSGTSLGDGHPLKQDGAANSKSKRRRTSPQDHAILEAAYQRNSKPDKNERAEIVSSVQLGEKEVQIWFQNRRQNDRRRSKPLQPHELLAHIRNNSPKLATSKSSPTETEGTQVDVVKSGVTPHGHPSPALLMSEELTRPASRASSIRDLLNPTSSNETAASNAPDLSNSQQSAEVSTPPSSLEAGEGDFSPIPTQALDQAENVSSDQLTQHSSGCKRDYGQMLDESSLVHDSVSRLDLGCATIKEPLKRSSSVRLAMTVDGAVKVRMNNEPTPSPPKERAPAPMSEQKKCGLIRSKSTLDDVDVFKSTNNKASRQFGAGFGRSRDARTWEFYADSNAKDALSTQMEAERNGSAVGAINLIRSNSSKSRLHALSPVPSRGNARQGGAADKSDKPKLSRARSSLARLQSSEADKPFTNPNKRRPGHVRSPSGDSDKENWAPGTRDSEKPAEKNAAECTSMSRIER